MRNVGFVKVEQDEEQCMIHVHGKGFPAGAGGELTVYLFFGGQGELRCIPLGTASCTASALNEMWKYPRDKEEFKDVFDRINGVMLENEEGRRFASVWDDTPVDVSGVKVLWKKESAPAAEEKKDKIGNETAAAAENETVDAAENRAENETAGEPENAAENETADAAENSAGNGTEDVTEHPETEGEHMAAECPEVEEQEYSVRKIQRMELSKLARCEWKLANNQFLMHGYYNYHHLVFIERDRQILLGVPGIYHEKEARAAECFGFGSFISADELKIALNPDEKNDEEMFGYWCRPVKRNFRWE